jgi:hypothetical protein
MMSTFLMASTSTPLAQDSTGSYMQQEQQQEEVCLLP